MNETKQTQFSLQQGPDRKRSWRERLHPSAWLVSMVLNGGVDHLPPKANSSCLESLLPLRSIGQSVGSRKADKLNWRVPGHVFPSPFALPSSGTPVLPGGPVYKCPPSLPSSPISTSLPILPKAAPAPPFSLLASPPTSFHLSPLA
ncbi:hypothetical protein PMAA_072980 [Talaromyces marneffei ATCC 18224]|uniref:Uncharacterized protein n=1 Tax=Talaromyces marneffei (strain ATCC 18224 / CBS 334.59 / QM 7333) TaxID=441960 RepID=B6QA58_TALMQ|nr:hypothetical protein PMAA_072980 [Talaromyces marneffei ATCC 18224]